jgi:hypothetical protein
MKELVFVSGPNCPMSVEVEEKVILFEELNPDIKVTRLVAGIDDAEFNEKTKGYSLSATPTFAALEDENVLDIHEGRACEIKLLSMFSPENTESSSEKNTENNSESAKIVLFFASSWCSEDAENKKVCDDMWATMDEFSKANPEVDVLKIDVNLQKHIVPENCYDHPINALPTILLVKNNKLVKFFEETFSLEDLTNLID